MSLPKIFNYKGYSSPDPLDKASDSKKFIIMAVAQFLVALGLLAVILPNTVCFVGFNFFGHHFSSHAMIALEFIMASVVFATLFIIFQSSSSLIKIAIPFIAYFPLDLYLWSHFRMNGHPENAMWIYPAQSFLWALKSPILISLVAMVVDGIIFGIIGVFLARIIAQVLYAKTPYPYGPSQQQYSNLFRKEWSEEAIDKPARDWPFYILRLVGFIYMAYLAIVVLGKLGPEAWPQSIQNLITMTYANPALAINTYIKVGMMIALAFMGAYNKSLRFHTCIALITGHAVSTASSIFFHFYDTPSDSPIYKFLMTSAEADGLMIIVFVAILIKNRKDAVVFAPQKGGDPILFSIPLTLTKALYGFLSFCLLGFCIFILYLRLFTAGKEGLSAVFGYPDPMLGNTLTLYATMGSLTLMLIARDKLRDMFNNLIIMGLGFIGLISLLWIIFLDLHHGNQFQTRWGGTCEDDWYFTAVGLASIIAAGLVTFVRKLYFKIDCMINTLSPASALNAMAVTNCIFDSDDRQQAEIVHSIDDYVSNISGRKRGIFNIPFTVLEYWVPALVGLHPPFSSMSKEERKYFMRRYLLRNELERNKAFTPIFANFGFSIGSVLNTFAGFAFYSNLNNRYKIGYVPIYARDRLQPEFPTYAPPFKHIAELPKDDKDPLNFEPEGGRRQPLIAPRVTTVVYEPQLPDEVDYLIIGSGAGGATMAYRLACEQGIDPSRIVIIEQGPRIQPLEHINDNEMKMMGSLYKQGAMQQTDKANMTILQGQCVGGTTLINNAVCFKMPDTIKSQWESEFGIDLSDIEKEYELLKKELSIAPLGQPGINQIVKEKFEKAVAAFNAKLPENEKLIKDYPVKVNHLNNTGGGNWNLGDKRVRKRSMLATFIPWSEARGVKVIANLTAISFGSTTPGSRKADYVTLRSNSGNISKVKVKKAVIVAGGVLASSNIIMRSHVNNTNVGKNVSCNFAFTAAFHFNETIKAFDGEQITMGALDPKNRAAFETYFNPPSAFTLSSVPFYFEKREEVMNDYANLLNFGALVGSESRGSVLKKPNLINGRGADWSFGDVDLERIKYAFLTLIELGKLAGSDYAVLPTIPGIKLPLDDLNISQFTKAWNDFPIRMGDMFVGTAHPQGGNLMAAKGSSGEKDRTVTEDFLVDGYDNVFVCDASIFPTSITLNPQWTIMAMSSLAAKRVIDICK